ncbi:unnamed protein product [Clavelina lepadiformis]|uniref:Coiled-coil domain-containing protein 170 n=1 Tax=Clavelina lepadiformis TaxID=159417 RepID=A0ABP0GPR4_CLALP
MSSPSKGMRSSHLIDVNQNLGLLSSSYRPGGDLTQCPQAVELQEQVKAYRRELAKKDDLIAELSTASPRGDNKDLLDVMMDATTRNDRTTLNFDRPCLYMDSPPAELAGARMKIENLTFELRELQSKLELKDNFIHELRSKLKLMKEDNARQTALIQTLREHVHQAEHQSGTLEHITSKGSVTIQTLQRENREAQEKILDLEARLRNHALVKEGTEQEVETYKRKYHDAVCHIGDALNTDTSAGCLENAVEILVEKGRTLCQDNLLLESKIKTLEDALNAHNLETKASRETIMRLVSEVGKEQKNISEASNTLERFRKERDDALLDKDSMSRELDILKERILANDKTWASSREELTQTATKASMLSEDLKRLEYERSLATNEFRTFRESMAKILSDPYVEVEAREDAIKDRIRELAASERERKSQVDILEEKVTHLNNQLERQCELHHDSIRRAKNAERSTFSNEDRLREMENELASADVIRDTLRRDKEKYLAFLQQMALAMRMDEVAADLGYDFNTDVLIARASQLSKLESDALVEKTSSNYNLHRKVKALKEQLKSKELHMELIRKKIGQMEEKNQTRTALAIDRDDAIVTVQKLQRKVERLKHALGDERVNVTQLKAQLAETHQLKTVTLEQRRKIDELVNNVGKLSTTKERQRHKLSTLKRDLSLTETSAGQNSTRLRSQLDAVTDDLKSTKTLLDEVTRREKQLVDFREVVARMLGLDVTTLAIPDYEVISRLEKLIRNHHIGTAANTALDRSLDAMSTRFRAGYEYDNRYSTSPHPPPVDARYGRERSSSPRRHHHHHPRSRSPSPKRY